MNQDDRGVTDGLEPSGARQYGEALVRPRDPAKSDHVKAVQRDSPQEWAAWRLRIEVAPQCHFEDLFDFFVHRPSRLTGRGEALESQTWRWSPLDETTLSRAFGQRPQVLQQLRGCGVTDTLLTSGWLLKDDSGRIDGETTWSDRSYLLATEGHFAYIQLYQEVDH